MSRSFILWLLLLGALLGGCGAPPGQAGGSPSAPSSQPTSAATEVSRSHPSHGGHFRVRYTADQEPIPINTLHTWILHVEGMDGSPVEEAEITVDGDMPAHGHGLPTQPLVTEYLGDGDYRVEGMKFQMGGEWVIDLTITARGVTDTVRLPLLLD